MNTVCLEAKRLAPYVDGALKMEQTDQGSPCLMCEMSWDSSHRLTWLEIVLTFAEPSFPLARKDELQLVAALLSVYSKQ